MQVSILIALTGVVTFALYRIASILMTKDQNAAQARRLGCRDAPAYPYCGFLGIRHVGEILAADKKQNFPHFLEEREEQMSRLLGRQCSTFSVNLLGSKVYYTSDPRNIQAILATQFQDFHVGEVRHAIISEAIGDGIFGQNGKK